MLLLYESKIDSQSSKMQVEITPGVKLNKLANICTPPLEYIHPYGRKIFTVSRVKYLISTDVG